MENKYISSVDNGGTKIPTAIMEYPADGSVPHPVFEAEVPTEAQEGGEAVFQRIEASIKAALEANPDVEVLGVGIGAAGVVDGVVVDGVIDGLSSLAAFDFFTII